MLFLAALPVLGASSAASATEPVAAAEPVATKGEAKKELRWDDRWARFHPVEYVATAVVGPAAIAEYLFAPPQAVPHWTQTNPFDDGIRNGLRLRSPDALHAVWIGADWVDVALVVGTVGFDSVLVPLLRRKVDVAVQLSLMNCESFALSSVVAVSLYDTVGRARPSYADCQRDPNFNADCRISPTASFPSGHVNEAFTAAGLSCAHHQMLPLYGSRVLDALACARDVALAATDGVLRIMGDRHYATDVLAGGALGFAAGYGLPMALHYRRAGVGAAQTSWTIVPLAGGRMGLALVGTL